MKKSLGLFLAAALLATPLLSAAPAQASAVPDILSWSAAAHTLMIKQLARSNNDSLVMISMRDDKDKQVAFASGIILSADGLILTNYHLIDDGVKARITLANQKTYETTDVLLADKKRDLALLKIDATGLKPAALGDSAKMEIGDEVLAIGSPQELQNTVSTGIISGIRHEDDLDYLQTTAPYTHGSSGGALFNMQGEVVGVTTLGSTSGDLNLVIPSHDVQAFLQKAHQPQKLGTFAPKNAENGPDTFKVEEALNDQLGSFQNPVTGEKVPLTFLADPSYEDDAPEDLCEITMIMHSDSLYKYLVSDPSKPDSQQTADLLASIIKIARTNGLTHATVTLENRYDTRKVGTLDPLDSGRFNQSSGNFRITHTFAWASYEDKATTFTYLLEPGHNDQEQKKTLN